MQVQSGAKIKIDSSVFSKLAVKYDLDKTKADCIFADKSETKLWLMIKELSNENILKQVKIDDNMETIKSGLPKMIDCFPPELMTIVFLYFPIQDLISNRQIEYHNDIVINNDNNSNSFLSFSTCFNPFGRRDYKILYALWGKLMPIFYRAEQMIQVKPRARCISSDDDDYELIPERQQGRHLAKSMNFLECWQLAGFQLHFNRAKLDMGRYQLDNHVNGRRFCTQKTDDCLGCYYSYALTGTPSEETPLHQRRLADFCWALKDSNINMILSYNNHNNQTFAFDILGYILLTLQLSYYKTSAMSIDKTSNTINRAEILFSKALGDTFSLLRTNGIAVSNTFDDLHHLSKQQRCCKAKQSLTLPPLEKVLVGTKRKSRR